MGNPNLNMNLKMVAAAINLPKPDPEHPRGQDAHFIETGGENQWIGVFDGVGGWRKIGIDSGVYAKELMRNSVEFLKKNVKELPLQVLEEAYSKTTAQGSSTACILSWSGEEGGILRAANVGDSGFLVIRKGVVLFRSQPQQHKFNHPYQLGTTRDKPSVAQKIKLHGVEKGDLVLLATDGVLDNLHVSQMLLQIQHHPPHEDLQGLCRKIARAALMFSLNVTIDSPFSTAARQAGYPYPRRGKPDDITLVVARIE